MKNRNDCLENVENGTNSINLPSGKISVVENDLRQTTSQHYTFSIYTGHSATMRLAALKNTQRNNKENRSLNERSQQFYFKKSMSFKDNECIISFLNVLYLCTRLAHYNDVLQTKKLIILILKTNVLLRKCSLRVFLQMDDYLKTINHQF